MSVKLDNELRAKWSEYIMNLLGANEESADVDYITSNTFNFPCLDSEGNEKWIEVTVKVPKSDDGYEKREELKLKQTTKASKEAEREKKKAASKKDTDESSVNE